MAPLGRKTFSLDLAVTKPSTEMREQVEHSVFRRERADVDIETGLELAESQKLVMDEDSSVDCGSTKRGEVEVMYIIDPEGKGKQKKLSKTKQPGSKQTERGTIVFLNGLRGLAALMVVEQHLQLTPEVKMGSCSVDVFFVLSAFLLTMLFERKARQMLEKKASLAQWGAMLADYFSKRFFRVYPLVVAVALALECMSNKNRGRYYQINGKQQDTYSYLNVITFEKKSRFFVLWSLPVEIAYYFVIPVFVAAMLSLRHHWWMLALPLYVWIVHEGIETRRSHHMGLRPHLSTFIAGSLAAIIYSKINQWIEATKFEFCKWQRMAIRVVEVYILSLFLSLVFRGLLFHGFIKNPYVTNTDGFPFTSLPVSALIVIEMLLPSSLSRFLEWNLLCYAGKISFSMYMLHAFIIYNPDVKQLSNKYDRFFVNFGGTMLLATASYWTIEYPSQLLAQHISKWLSRVGAQSTPIPQKD